MMKKTAQSSRQPARRPKRPLPVFISHCLRCGTEFDGEWCPKCDAYEAQTYERFTPDRRYSARCACQTTQEGHSWIVWTISPTHLQPREVTRCESFEAARAVVDDYIDHQVPRLENGSRF